MKNARQLSLFTAAFALAGVCGWLAADSSESPPASIHRPAATKSTDRKRIARSAREMPPQVAARLAPLRAAKTQDERLRAITLLAQSLPVSELAVWYEAGWIPRRETVESLQFYHITGKRWIAEDGEGMVRHHLAKDRTRLDACSDWAWQQPTAAFKFLDGLKDPQDFALVMNSLAGSAAHGDPEQALQRITRYQAALAGESSWGVEHMIYRIARDAPGLLDKEAMAWPEQLRRKAVDEITRGSLQKDFAAGLAELAGKADGLDRFLRARCWELKGEYAAHVDKLPDGWLAALLSSSNSLPNDDPERWLKADYAGIGVTETKARQLRATAARSLLARNPERLPELLTADLDSKSRDYLIKSSLTQLYGIDPEKAAQMRDQLGLPADTNGLWGEVVAELPSKGPPKHFDSPSQMGELASWSRDDQYLAVVKMQGWDEGEIQQALKTFGSMSAADRGALTKALWQGGAPLQLRAESVRLSMQDQGDAVVKDDYFRGYCDFASKWGIDEPGAAARWVESLPAGEGRLWMAKNVSAAWASYDSQAATEWVDSLGLKEQLQKLGKEEP